MTKRWIFSWGLVFLSVLLSGCEKVERGAGGKGTRQNQRCFYRPRKNFTKNWKGNLLKER